MIKDEHVVVFGGQFQASHVVSDWKPSIPRRCWWSGVLRWRPKGEEWSAATRSSTPRRRTAARLRWKRRRRGRRQPTYLTWPTRAHGRRLSQVYSPAPCISSRSPQSVARVSATAADHGASLPKHKVRIFDNCIMKYGSHCSWIGTIKLKKHYKITKLQNIKCNGTSTMVPWYRQLPLLLSSPCITHTDVHIMYWAVKLTFNVIHNAIGVVIHHSFTLSLQAQNLPF